MKKAKKSAASVDASKSSAKNRFKKAGMTADFEGLYSILSADVHNNTSHLQYRHVRQRDGLIELKLYSGEGGYAESALFAFAELLMVASEAMHERFGDGKNSVKGIRYIVEPLQQRLRESNTNKN